MLGILGENFGSRGASERGRCKLRDVHENPKDRKRKMCYMIYGKKNNKNTRKKKGKGSKKAQGY